METQRPPLKETHANVVNARVEHVKRAENVHHDHYKARVDREAVAVPEADKENERRQQLERRPRDEEDLQKMRDWQKQWRRIMNSSTFYFDGFNMSGRDSQNLEKIRAHMALLGTRFKSFFEHNVTHVVTRRPLTGDHHPNDVLSRAQRLGMKIWTYEKLIRFMTNLLGHSPLESLQPAQTAKLAQLLREEKLRGPTDRDPQVPRDDYHYFKGPYLLVWDPTHNQKPTMYKEYPKPPTPEEGDWPQFRLTSIGRCPFIYEEPAQLARRAVTAVGGGDDEQQRERASKRPRVSPEDEPADAKDAVQRVVAASGRLPVAQEQAVPAKEETQAASATRADASSSMVRQPGPPPPPQRDAEPHGRFFEIQASGVQRSTSTSAVRSVVQSTGEMSGTLTGAGGQFASREVKNLQRKVLGRPSVATIRAPSRPPPEAMATQQAGATTTHPAVATTTTTNTTNTNASTNTAATNQPAAATRTAAKPTRRDEKKRARKEDGGGDRRMHICENCNERYEILAEHVLSRRHMRFANDEKNFERLDRLICTIQRVPLGPSSPPSDEAPSEYDVSD